MRELAVAGAVKAMLDDMEDRFKNMEEALLVFLLVCCILDPRFKSMEFPGCYDEWKHQSVNAFKKHFMEAWTELPEANEVEEVEVEEVEAEQPQPKRAKTAEEKLLGDVRQKTVTPNDFFDVEEEVVEEQGTKQQITAQEEIERYLKLEQQKMSTDVLDWWSKHEKEFPRTSRMARQYLAIPATSACVERFFSAAGLAFDDLRQAMTEHNLEALMWAKFNYVKVRKALAEGK